MGGWNTRDSISSMPPTDAIALTNVVPIIDGVQVVPGCESWSQIVASNGGRVDFLKNWHHPLGERLIAVMSKVTGDKKAALYDVTDAPTNPAAISADFLTSYVSSLEMLGRMCIVGTGIGPRELLYSPVDGTTSQQLSISGPTQELVDGTVHKSRSYFITRAEAGFWYSEVNALGGDLTFFPVDRVTRGGGVVDHVLQWTRDGGSGPDDYFVLITKSGEVVVYQGSNPGDADDWALVGIYQLGRVLATTQFGGRIHVVSDFDYHVLPDDLMTNGLRQPGKLSGAAQQAAKHSWHRWQILVDPVIGWKIVNVVKGDDFEQHITDMRTGASFKATYPAYTWSTFRGELMLGGFQHVCRVKGHSFFDGVSTTAIPWVIQTAFDNLGTELPKVLLGYRPKFSAHGDMTYESGLAMDYDRNQWLQDITLQGEGQDWNPNWDSDWLFDTDMRMEWLVAAGEGQRVSLLMKGEQTTFAPTYHGCDWKFELRPFE